jgi:hypothetical protein
MAAFSKAPDSGPVQQQVMSSRKRCYVSMSTSKMSISKMSKKLTTPTF